MKVVPGTLLGLLLVLMSFAPAADAGDGSGQLALSTVSSRPEMVSGGDTMVQLRIPAGRNLDEVTLEVNGINKSNELEAGSDPVQPTALLSGLSSGVSHITARLAGYQDAKLLVVNHPVTGPILSGTHQTPFYCETADSGLGAPLDQNCSATTQRIYRYRTTGGTFATLADPTAPYPANGVMTTTTTGETVPYAIVTEKGTINRAIYAITTLIDVGPGSTQEHPGAGWNRKLLYQFGGGCASGYHQSVTGNNVNGMVAKGYATAQSSLNIFGVHCSDSLSAETLSMVKEHFIERFGRPDGTIGFGGSGGSMAQQMINNNFPGLLDGSALSRSFTDNAYAGNVLLDCTVVDAFVDSAAGWTTEQKHAVKGWALEQTCNRIVQVWHRVVFEPSTCDPHIPAGDIYDPVINPTGIRCDLWTGNIGVYGIDPDTGFARQTTDNTGVQYGLEAVRDGTISFSQFLDLNANVGGINFDGQPVPGRIAASDEALRIAYRQGQMNEGGAGFASVPTIENRDYSTEVTLNGHSVNHALAMRARLDNSNGNHGSQVIYTSPTGLSNERVFGDLSAWIDAINMDQSGLSRKQKVTQQKPDGISDSCYDASGDLISREPASWNSGDCGTTYPSFKVTRQIAGGPAANDVLKCQLKAIDPGEYGVAGPLDGTQVAALAGVFPDGVCDYTKPGVEQSVSRATWRALPLGPGPDTSAPDTAISSLPSSHGPVRDVEFEFSSSETGSSFKCRFDSNALTAFEPCESPVSYPAVQVGQHRFEVVAVDGAGNLDPTPAAAEFEVASPRGKLVVSPGSISFSPRHVGSVSGPRTVTLRNEGDASLAVGAIGLAGHNPGQFKLDGAGACAGRTLTAGHSCAFKVRFNPSFKGRKAARVEVAANAGVNRVYLSGKALPRRKTARISLAKGPLRMRSGKIILRVKCSTRRVKRCRGTARVSVRRAALGFHSLPGKMKVIATRKIAPGKGRHTVRIRPARVARRAIGKRGSLRAKVSFRIYNSGTAPHKVTYRRTLRR